MRKTRFVIWMARKCVEFEFVRKCRTDEAEEEENHHHEEDVVGVGAVEEETLEEEDEVAPGRHQDVGSHEVEVVRTPLGHEAVLIVPGRIPHATDVESLLLLEHTYRLHGCWKILMNKMHRRGTRL